MSAAFCICARDAASHHVQTELQQLMAIADVDGDGLIDYNEFVAATMHLSKLNKEELLQRVRQQHMFCIELVDALLWWLQVVCS